MKPKFYLASFIACFWVMQTFAQKKQNIYFLKDDGKYVGVKDSADFIRIIQEPDPGTVLFNLLDYYLNGKVKMVGKTATIKPIKLEGSTISYYPDGNRKQVATYADGYSTGMIYDYYPNSRLYRTFSKLIIPVFGSTNYQYDKQISSAADTTVLRILHSIAIQTDNVFDVFDSIGIQTVKNGSGYYKVFNQESKLYESEGELKEGKKNGIWKSNINQGKFINTEEYDDGRLIKGTCIIENGTVVKYLAKDVLPAPKGISKGFSSNFYKYVNTPAFIKHVDKTTLFVSFIIEKDGSLTNIEVNDKPSSDLDLEAARLIGESPKWNPGLQHGVPVRVFNTVFINLK